MIQSTVRRLREAIYGLKREFGVPVDLYEVQPGVTNLATGVKNDVVTRHSLDRVALLPTVTEYKFHFEPALSKDFRYGGTYDSSTKRFLIDQKDLPWGLKINRNFYLVFEAHRYNVEKIDTLDLDVAYLITGKEVQWEQPYQVIEYAFRDVINFGGVLNSLPNMIALRHMADGLLFDSSLNRTFDETVSNTVEFSEIQGGTL